MNGADHLNCQIATAILVAAFAFFGLYMKASIKSVDAFDKSFQMAKISKRTNANDKTVAGY